MLDRNISAVPQKVQHFLFSAGKDKERKSCPQISFFFQIQHSPAFILQYWIFCEKIMPEHLQIQWNFRIIRIEWDSLPPKENKILRHPPGVTSTERSAKVKAAPKPKQVDE